MIVLLHLTSGMIRSFNLTGFEGVSGEEKGIPTTLKLTLPPREDAPKGRDVAK